MSTGQYHNKQWSVEDFQRYHSQQMSNAERHALEKAALDDPFLEDALEGYAFAKEPEKDLAALKEKIQPPKDEGKIVAFSYRPNRWLKIAAILVLVAAFTWLIYPAERKPSTELAVNTRTQPATAATMDTSEQPANVASPRASVATEPGELQPSTAPALTAPTKEPAMARADDTRYSAKDAARNENEPAQTKATEQNDAAKEKQAVTAMRTTESPIVNQIKGRVVDNQGAPIPYATISVPQNNTNVATDVNGEFSLRNSQEENLVANVNAPGFQTANAPLNAGNADNKIVLQESQEALSEVVITGLGQSRKKSVSAASTPVTPGSTERITLINVRLLLVSPQATDSIRKLSAALPVTDSTGVVKLNFLLSRNGKATNIAVSKSLCQSCDAAAIRLLQQLPPLQKSGTGKAEIRVDF